MKRLTIYLLILASTPFISTGQEQSNEKEIIGYLANWSGYRRKGVFNPQNIDYSKYTVLVYSFFYPDENGKVYSCDPYGDKKFLRPTPNIVQLAHKQGVKVMVSLGGWTKSTHFATIAADPDKRKKLAEECVRVLKTYNFDGIDIDWEGPGNPRNGGGPQDTKNFTLMMQEIRTAIDEYGKSVGDQMLLSAAFGAGDDHFKAVEWDKVSPLLDHINVMTYSHNGTWSEISGHNAPLHQNPNHEKGCTESSITNLLTNYQVPVNKVHIGLPFYGKALLFPKGKAALGSTEHLHKSDTAGVFSITKGNPAYYDIVQYKEEFDTLYDPISEAPYLLSKDKSVFVSYDNPTSIRKKCEYVNKIGAGGVIIWDVSMDYIETKPGSGKIKETPLTNTVAITLKHDPKRLKRIKRKNTYE